MLKEYILNLFLLKNLLLTNNFILLFHQIIPDSVDILTIYLKIVFATDCQDISKYLHSLHTQLRIYRIIAAQIIAIYIYIVISFDNIIVFSKTGPVTPSKSIKLGQLPPVTA